MTDAAGRTVILCSCEDSFTPDASAVARGCKGARVEGATQLCRKEIDRFRRIAAATDDLVVACTQEAPVFTETLEADGFQGAVSFANIRETAGWSSDGAGAGPKMAALIAAATQGFEQPPSVTLESQGVILILGRDQAAVDAAKRLEAELDVTLILTGAEEVIPPRVSAFPVRKGRVRAAKGHLGAFELVLDDVAEPAPSSRGAYRFGRGRDGLASECDIVLDLTGSAPLFPAAELRPGYLRADPTQPLQVLEAVTQATNLVGTFDKPRYITFRQNLCAHSRSKKTGCTRCLDLCPTGAISPGGDSVVIDAAVCAGCGACAAVCPTGAAEYALPTADQLLARLRTVTTVFREAGGSGAVLLMHDATHGADMIDAAARFGEGLPAHVIPIEVNEVTQVGVEAIAAAFAYGVAGLVFLTRAKPKHDVTGLERTVEIAKVALGGLGYGADGVSILATDDPDAMIAALGTPVATTPAPAPATFQPRGTKRGVLNLAMRELHRVAPAPIDIVALPAGAPFGRVDIKVDGCTLCLACVSACPTKALSDDQERPKLSFKEDACVQCGLCASTCPEKVITLEPRLNFPAFNAPPVTVKEEEPFHCIACGKPFGTKSTIERVAAKLEGRHWMFSGELKKRADVIRMCDTCRVEAVTNEGFDPYGGPRPKTTEDYIREREQYLADRAKLEKGEG